MSMRAATTGLLGAVIFARHGDRNEFFQDPLTYDPSNTVLTPLGTVEENFLGQFLQATYIDNSSSTAIEGLDFPVADLDQLLVRADAAGEGVTIVSSTMALLSGLFPPTPAFNITLANGTTVVGALGGNQFISVETVEPNLDISLNSFTSCPNFDAHTLSFYGSPQFATEAQEAEPFLNALKPFLGGRSINFTNMFNILPATFVEQAYGFANFHENGVFSDVSTEGIGNVAFRTILPSVFSSLNRIANASDPLKLALNGISYKPFISFFNLTAASVDGEPLFGVVDYASSLALELHANTDASGALDPFLTFQFKNGTPDSSFHPVSLGVFNGSTSVPLSTFINTLSPAAINNTAQWCRACNQTTLRGCAACSA